MGGVGYPAGVANVDAYAGGCVLGSGGNAPKNTCHPGFVENCHLSKFLLRGERSEIRKLRILQHSTCDMHSSNSCDGATHVLPTLLRTACTTYSINSTNCGLTFLHSYAVGHIASAYVNSQSFFQQNSSSITVAGNYPAFCGTHIPHLTLPY